MVSYMVHSLFIASGCLFLFDILIIFVDSFSILFLIAYYLICFMRDLLIVSSINAMSDGMK